MELLASLLLLSGISAFIAAVIFLTLFALHIMILLFTVKVLRLLAKWLEIKVKKGY
jgi:hypothetical protein